MTLKQFRDLLLTVTDRVGHGEQFKDGGNYVVWHEVGKISNTADSAQSESGYRIAVDYYTKDEYDLLPDKITALFDNDEIAADNVVIDYEPDTGYTHYAWTCEVI